MSSWHPAKVERNQPAADGLFNLDLDIRGTPLQGAHRLPGQYVKLRLEGLKEGFFAIAAAPDPRGPRLEFLIKSAPGLADALGHLAAGATVDVSDVQGKGFPIEKARGKRVLLFATGSGISPVRSLIQTLLREPAAYGPITLFFGARTPDAFAYAAELEQWTRQGLRVIRTVSRPGATGWQGLTGYVQSHVPDEPLQDAVAYLCGQKEMVKGVTDALNRQGLPKEQVFLNY